jgi:hypothetical protein
MNVRAERIQAWLACESMLDGERSDLKYHVGQQEDLRDARSKRLEAAVVRPSPGQETNGYRVAAGS